jgi:oligopeptide/dipeptide ABC transporter ATP-binding protein
MESLLEIRNLKVEYHTYEGVISALDIEYLKLQKREILSLVGESGCGKSTLALSILKILPPNGIIKNGNIIFDGLDLVKMNEEQMKKIRGKRISIVFQDPRASFNPVFTIGEQITRVLITHKNLSKKESLQEVENLFKMVGLPDPKRIINSYPHELSTGMCQRALIAMALSCKPDLLIADEPTSALDVSIQAQIIELLRDLKNKIETSILYITHDLAVAAQLTERIAVMYAGNIVEIGNVEDIYDNPLHPYTYGLLKSIPKANTAKLETISGEVPDLFNPPSGCRFHPRCPYAMEVCKKQKPMLMNITENHLVSCFLYSEKK